jgi:hypothetical protein
LQDLKKCYFVIKALKSNETVHVRLKAFEDIVKLSELFNMNDNMINFMLRSIRDLLKVELTPLESRSQAFEYLIKFFKQKVSFTS